MASSRGEFGSRFGFVMAASGSAVGLGNIWGFPTQAASNGGAAFLLVYLFLAFVLAYPVLMAELVIGRHAHADHAQRLVSTRPSLQSKMAEPDVVVRLVGEDGPWIAGRNLSQ